MTFTLLILALLATGGKVQTTITEISSLAECRAVQEFLVGEIERRGGTVQKAECK